jgi:hypothetical protein
MSGSQGRHGRVTKTSPPTEFDPRTAQIIASRYTAWAIPGQRIIIIVIIINLCSPIIYRLEVFM